MREDAGTPAVLDRLELAGDPPGERLHVGWGSFRNLDIAALRRSRWAVLLDINIHQFRVWEAVLAALRQAGNAEDFIARAAARLPTAPRLRQFLPDTQAWLAADRDRRGSWLSAHAPERFAHIRAMARENRIVPACLDMRAASVKDGAGGASGPFPKLARGLAAARAAGVVPDTLYISNVPWMLAQPKGFFGEDHGAGPDAAWLRARANLGLLAPHFGHVVSAMHLAPDARMDDLQWETRLCAPGEFMSEAAWEAMARPGLRPEGGFPSA